MPFPGGDADKVGNRYEALWTVYCLLQILSEDAESIHLEQIGDEWDGVEFTLKKSAITEFHQVKRQNSNNGRWLLATLASRGILSDAHRLLRMYPPSEFVFVSQDNVAQLHELTDRARSLKEFMLFQEEGLKKNDHKSAFEKCCEYLQISEEVECYDFLKLFQVKVIGESPLMELVEARAKRLIAGNATAVVSLLRSYAEKHLQTEITADPLWEYLKAAGFAPVQWSKDTNIVLNFRKGNERYTNQQKYHLINNHEIVRDDTNEKICTAIRGDKKFIAIVGGAGSGKSIVMQQSFKYLSECSDTVFGFRIDRLSPKQLPEEVGQSLGFPESPVHVLANIAGNSASVLFIDQLDAVSLTSGRNSDFFDCIHDIFNQANQYPKMKLVVGCRQFDLENDHRFRRFFTEENSKTVTVENLSSDEVEYQLKTAQVSSKKLNEKQKLLLQQPLLLGVFIQVASDEGAFDFTHEGDLFRLKVRHAKDGFKERFPERKVLWTQVTEMLSDYMSQHQTLSAPERVIESNEDDAKIMASSGVLLYENRRYSFFHESFFDYVFANRFLDSGSSICDLLLSDEQHLFRRGQVRQILLLQRSENVGIYLENIAELLRHERIRLHIKVSVLEWMEALAEPTSEELKLLFALAEDERHSEIKQVIWNSLSGRSAWFALLDRENIIYQWLTHENEQWVDHGVWYLRTVQREQAGRVVDLLLPLYKQDKESWRQLLLGVIHQADLGGSRKFFDLFLLLLADGVLDETIAANNYFFAFAPTVSSKKPEWIGELLTAYIRRQLVLSPINPEQHYTLDKGRGSFVKKHIDTAANEFPKAFIDSLFPLVFELTELTQRPEDPSYCITDRFWGGYLDGSISYHMHTFIIKGVQKAIENIAKNDSDSFRKLFNVWKDSPYFTIQYLMVAGLAQAGEQFSNEAVEYLIENDCRLNMGSGYGFLSRQLIESSTLNCSEEKLLQLEDRLLNFYGISVGFTTWEGKKFINNHFGYDQFTLLTGIPTSRQSHSVSKRIKEWQRKFLCELPAKPHTGIKSGTVRSPIVSDGIKYMTDQQWLKAIARYSDDKHDHKEFLKGGTFQLAQVLEGRTTEEPERFAKLLLALPENTNRAYFDNIIMGLYPVNGRKVEHIDLLLFEQCVLQVFNMPDKPCGRWLSRVISHYKGLELSDQILNVVLWFAQNSSDPDAESSEISTNQDFVADLATKAINSVRGTAVESIAKLIFKSKRYYQFFKPYLPLLCQTEANLAVRSEMAYFIIATNKYDKDYAYELFGLLFEGQPDEFLAARKVDEYIHYAIFDDLNRILPIVQRKIDSRHDFVQQAGARHACIVGLVSENHDDLIQQCLDGRVPHRKGVAEVFTTNITSDVHSKQCMEYLTVLFEDDSAEVRQEASFCFSKFRNEDLLPYRSFISSFITSRAIEENASTIASLLVNSIDKLPDVVIQLIKEFLDREGETRMDVSTAAMGDSYELNELLLRLYAQTTSPEIKTYCLDAIDRMVSFGSSELNNELSQFDR